MQEPTSRLHPRLVALSRSFEGQVFDLSSAAFTVGRQSSNSLQLPHASVSRRHCVFRIDDAGCHLRDLDSSCGTFVNDVPVSERRLEHGDSVRVGEDLFLFLQGEDPAPVQVSSESGRHTLASTVELSVDASAYLDAEQVFDAGKALAALGPEDPTAQRLGALLSIATALPMLDSVEELARRLTELTFEVVPADRAAVLLDDGGELETIHAAGRSDAGTEPRVSRTVTRRVLNERIAVLCADVGEEPELAATASVDPETARSLLCVPLVAWGEALGAIWADAGRSSRFTREHLELLTAAAGIAAVALVQTRRRESLERENRRLRDAELDHDLVGESPAMEKILGLVARVAGTDLTVLVTGESGTGKELVARALHRNSTRADGPFVALNCATLSETLLESELFGHEKGAFTGAVGRKQGKLEVAHGGTIFLDEVGEIPLALQARLLRALEEREFERVGGTRSVRVDVRIVAATNKDLEKAIDEGSFRRDLFHRLNVFHLSLPRLAERERDVLLLAHHFAASICTRLNRPFLGLSPEARACLLAYDWPGNVRELRNAIERAVVLSADGLLRPEDLPEALREGTADLHTPSSGYHVRVNEAKRRIVLEAVEASDGNLSAAARSLALNRTYLHRLLKSLAIS